MTLRRARARAHTCRGCMPQSPPRNATATTPPFHSSSHTSAFHSHAIVGRGLLLLSSRAPQHMHHAHICWCARFTIISHAMCDVRCARSRLDRVCSAERTLCVFLVNGKRALCAVRVSRRAFAFTLQLHPPVSANNQNPMRMGDPTSASAVVVSSSDAVGRAARSKNMLVVWMCVDVCVVFEPVFSECAFGHYSVKFGRSIENNNICISIVCSKY